MPRLQVEPFQKRWSRPQARASSLVIQRGQQKNKRRIPVNSNFVHRIGDLVVFVHLHGWAFWHQPSRGIGGMCIRPAREQPWPRCFHVVRAAGTMMRMLEGSASQLSDPRQVPAVASEEIMQILRSGMAELIFFLQAI